MLFTKSSEAGIQLENRLLLTPEQFAKTQIPANKNRISEWARDNHVNIMLQQSDQSDFNCILGIMTDSEISEATHNANKKMLKHLGDELIQFINSLPSNVDDAVDAAIVDNEVHNAIKCFIEKIEEILGKDTILSIKIGKLCSSES